VAFSNRDMRPRAPGLSRYGGANGGGVTPSVRHTDDRYGFDGPLRRLRDRRVADQRAQPREHMSVPFILHAHRMPYHALRNCICKHCAYIQVSRIFHGLGLPAGMRPMSGARLLGSARAPCILLSPS
jgi:hypothetical protein